MDVRRRTIKQRAKKMQRKLLQSCAAEWQQDDGAPWTPCIRAPPIQVDFLRTFSEPIDTDNDRHVVFYSGVPVVGNDPQLKSVRLADLRVALVPRGRVRDLPGQGHAADGAAAVADDEDDDEDEIGRAHV